MSDIDIHPIARRLYDEWYLREIRSYGDAEMFIESVLDEVCRQMRAGAVLPWMERVNALERYAYPDEPPLYRIKDES